MLSLTRLCVCVCDSRTETINVFLLLFEFTSASLVWEPLFAVMLEESGCHFQFVHLNTVWEEKQQEKKPTLTAASVAEEKLKTTHGLKTSSWTSFYWDKNPSEGYWARRWEEGRRKECTDLTPTLLPCSSPPEPHIKKTKRFSQILIHKTYFWFCQK